MITLSIIIYVASPLDYARYRHAALYLESGEASSPETANANANTEANAKAPAKKNPKPNTEAVTNPALQLKSSVLEIVGSTGFFTFAERLNWDIPTSSTGEAPPKISVIDMQYVKPSLEPANPNTSLLGFDTALLCMDCLYIARVIRVDTLNVDLDLDESGECTTPTPPASNRHRKYNLDSDLDPTHNPDLDLDPISHIRSIISTTPVRCNGDTGVDGDEDWNSQNWVGDALGRLVLEGYLSGQ
ncbi:hypothetical protein PENANT_c017G04046 [Penicillium antarcticum]|uniref:Uncharacterized protein n=1 Tax=Penicillium antarcticum TaxID=416450 RepID=A0A1V6Q279_9EURO|nr:hypothetical protein PENANT_c017G04046 [Penicillium antarcticum]